MCRMSNLLIEVHESVISDYQKNPENYILSKYCVSLVTVNLRFSNLHIV